jgi:hypothetical protein
MPCTIWLWREEFQAQHPELDWQVSMMPGKCRALKKRKTEDAMIDKLDKPRQAFGPRLNNPSW